MQGFKRSFHSSKLGLSELCYLVEIKFLLANRRILLPPPLGFVLSNKTVYTA